MIGRKMLDTGDQNVFERGSVLQRTPVNRLKMRFEVFSQSGSQRRFADATNAVSMLSLFLYYLQILNFILVVIKQ
jgi:hypothetical protein